MPSAGLPQAFRGARLARPQSVSYGSERRERTGPRQPPNGTAWPAALAIMLVANLAAPAAGAVPRRASPSEGDGEVGGAVATTWSPDAPPTANAASPAFGEVVVRPMARASIKSDYTFYDFVNAVAAARAPFHHLGESMGDAYTMLSGQEIDPHVRQGVQQGADVLDLATGLLPGVPMLRLPGDLADIFKDGLEGKSPDSEKIAGLLQYADPRTMGAGLKPHADSSAPAHSPSAPRPVDPSLPAHRVDAPSAEFMQDRLSMPRSDAVQPGSQGDTHDKAEDAGAEDAREAVLSPALPPGEPAHVLEPASPLHIVDERQYLHGYEQHLPVDQLPPGEPSRLVLVNGHHYLRGEAGDYRARRGLSADHWLVDAPQGSERRAQVPVTYDASTGKWHAHAPLRLCGGGCGSSRLAHPADSIAGSFDEIFSAVRHLPDENVREAIQTAYSELSELHLRRTNRADLQPIRDNSIINHRTVLRDAMRKTIDPSSPLIKQQRIAAEITANYYLWTAAAEAFCQENAEILFHFLLESGISKRKIRMITFKPQNRPPHVMVLYTESEHLIALLDRSTPVRPLHRDGISHEFFREAAYLTRHSTILLDPWSTLKAVSFGGASNRFDAGRLINRALVDIGHTPGSPYIVSLTRPLGIHRTSPNGSLGQGSLGSSGSSSGHSALNPPSRSDSPSSGDSMSLHEAEPDGSR